jgi:ArsR family transcriptional regulator, lead/cadmium/zinc/bismuth-responsive transcriptional repressor
VIDEGDGVDVAPAGRPEDERQQCCDTAGASARAGLLQRELVPVDVAERMAALFKVLGDPGRCRLLSALMATGELCVCDLAAGVGMSVSNASHHLRLLRDQRLVRARRIGKMVLYSLDDSHVRLLLESTSEHARHDGALGREGA